MVIFVREFASRCNSRRYNRRNCHVEIARKFLIWIAHSPCFYFIKEFLQFRLFLNFWWTIINFHCLENYIIKWKEGNLLNANFINFITLHINLRKLITNLFIFFPKKFNYIFILELWRIMAKISRQRASQTVLQTARAREIPKIWEKLEENQETRRNSWRKTSQ